MNTKLIGFILIFLLYEQILKSKISTSHTYYNSTALHVNTKHNNNHYRHRDGRNLQIKGKNC